MVHARRNCFICYICCRYSMQCECDMVSQHICLLSWTVWLAKLIVDDDHFPINTVSMDSRRGLPSLKLFFISIHLCLRSPTRDSNNTTEKMKITKWIWLRFEQDHRRSLQLSTKIFFAIFLPIYRHRLISTVWPPFVPSFLRSFVQVDAIASFNAVRPNDHSSRLPIFLFWLVTGCWRCCFPRRRSCFSFFAALIPNKCHEMF